MATGSVARRRALISVSDKRGVIDFAAALVRLGWELISTGGSARELARAGLAVVPVEEYTGFPEILDGRVKTLHPRVHGGILFRRDVRAHEAATDAHGIVAIDMVVVNLYPFERVAADLRSTQASILENIDIGGPALLRSAAKNHHDVLVVTDPATYGEVIAALETDRVDDALRRRLAAIAFARTAAYDAAIHAWLSGIDQTFPQHLVEPYERIAELRYGENPHQSGAFYRRAGAGGPTLGSATLLPGGKEMSYNNYLDADAALRLVRDMPEPGVAIIKHATPCGAAVAADLASAGARAIDGNPTSAYGGIVAVNREVDEALARTLTDDGRFFEVVVAPGFAPAALDVLRRRPKWGASVRLLAVGPFDATVPLFHDVRGVLGGLLVQQADLPILPPEAPRVATKVAPSPAQRRDLELAWIIAKHARSNAITLVKDGMLVGVGAGQTSRLRAVEIAVTDAGERARGAALGSDAFFPFADGIDAAATGGIAAIIQPGGSVRDADVIATADRHGMAMLMTGMRHFRH